MTCVACTLEIDDGDILLDLECGHSMHQDCGRRLQKQRNWENVTRPACRSISRPTPRSGMQNELPATQVDPASEDHGSQVAQYPTQRNSASQLSPPRLDHMVQDADFGFSLTSILPLRWWKKRSLQRRLKSLPRQLSHRISLMDSAMRRPLSGQFRACWIP